MITYSFFGLRDAVRAKVAKGVNEGSLYIFIDDNAMRWFTFEAQRMGTTGVVLLVAANAVTAEAYRFNTEIGISNNLLDRVRSRVAVLCKMGYTEAVRELLSSYNATRVTEVHRHYLADFESELLILSVNSLHL